MRGKGRSGDERKGVGKEKGGQRKGEKQGEGRRKRG